MKYDYLHLYIQIDCLRHIFPINVEHSLLHRKTYFVFFRITFPILFADNHLYVFGAFAHQTAVGVVVERFRHTRQI